MKPIKKPDWNIILGGLWPYGYKTLDQWFQENVEPVNKLIKGAVRVASANGKDWNDEPAMNLTHQAWLIGVEEIETESAEDVLRDLVENYPLGDVFRSAREFENLKERVKRALENKGEKYG